MKKTLPVLAIGLMVVSAAGITVGDTSFDTKELKNKYNSNTDQLPSFMSDLIGDQTINLNYENMTFGVEMDGVKINRTSENGFNETTLKVWADSSDVENITNSKEPIKALNNRLKNDEIRYETQGVVNTVKFFVAEQLLKIGSFL
ncbi:MAG: hypothetical protein H8Z69_05920 [Nanohaloarchaea archaeon]|nr:hypothetical protein [Candidatus Nanohaloarchaea archaeon]